MASPFAMAVPKGGSNCDKCMYSGGDRCKNKDFIGSADGMKQKGEDRFIDPDTGHEMPGDQYCCNFYDWRDRPKSSGYPLPSPLSKIRRK